MRDLTFVGMSDDGASMIFTDAQGQEFLVPADERVSLALRIDRSNPPVSSDIELTPRDIQARIRAGATVEDIAAETGTSIDRIERYSGPPLAERAFMSERAQSVELRRQDGPVTLADVVAHHVAQDGVDADDIEWDAWRRDDQLWTVVASFPGSAGNRIATWTYDHQGRTIIPADPEGARLIGATVRPSTNVDADADVDADVERDTIITDRPTLVAVPEEPVAVSIDEELDLDIEDDIDDEVVAVEPEPEPEPVPEPESEPESKQKRRGKRGRTRVPSWDEILFGAPE